MEIGELEQHGNRHAEFWTARHDVQAFQEPHNNLADTISAVQVIQLVVDHSRRRVVDGKLPHDELYRGGGDCWRHRGGASGSRQGRRVQEVRSCSLLRPGDVALGSGGDREKLGVVAQLRVVPLKAQLFILGDHRSIFHLLLHLPNGGDQVGLLRSRGGESEGSRHHVGRVCYRHGAQRAAGSADGSCRATRHRLSVRRPGRRRFNCRRWSVGQSGRRIGACVDRRRLAGRMRVTLGGSGPQAGRKDLRQ